MDVNKSHLKASFMLFFQCRFNSGFLAIKPWVRFVNDIQIVLIHIMKGKVSIIISQIVGSFRVDNAEVLCLGLVSFTVFMLAMPLFKTSGGVLLQEAPPSIHSSALTKCWRQVLLYPINIIVPAFF